MSTKLALAIGMGVVIGPLGMALFGKDLTYMEGMHQMPDGTWMPNEVSDMHAAMGDMMAALEGKEGDAFDQAFLAEMIVHHEGAVAMAQAALENAAHEELKQMAQAIISAQTGEIEQMRQWQESWYGN